ncbi:MAG: helix-turn-helix transcriptional regulator [bacterium]
MPESHRVSRLLEMVSLLQSGSGWGGAELAQRFGVSRTRIYNDIRALRQAGVPVRRSRAGYWIEPTFFLPSVQLSPNEVLALLFPLEFRTTTDGRREVEDSARAKLLSCLPPRLRREAEEMLQRTSVRLPAAEASGEVFAELRRAIVERRRVAIVYAGRHDERLRRLELDPYGIAFRKHAWYVVGFSASHREVRTFRVSRVHAVEPTPLHFSMPDDFSVEDHFRGAWYVFSGTRREIGVRFAPQVARLVKERVPHPGQQIQTLSDGTIFYRAQVNNLDEVAWWLVQYGGAATVLYPRELQDKVVALASDILHRYGISAPRRPLRYPTTEDIAPYHVSEPQPPRSKGKS